MTLSIVKLGGSAITEKAKPFTVRVKAIRSMCAQVAKHVNDGGEVVVIHGGGSYGHPVALMYRLNEGIVDEKSYVGVALTRLAMRELNEVIVREFLRAGGKPYVIEPSSSTIVRRGALEKRFLNIVKLALRNGFIPILYGDVALNDGNGKVAIVSGDVIASTLAIELKADKLIYVLDVNGIYPENPKKKPNLKPIRVLTRDMINKINIHGDGDATGGILRKIEEGFKAFENGVRLVCFLNWRRGNLLKALRGLEFKGTILGGNRY